MENYASHGFRILVLANKVIVSAMAKAGKISKLTREQVWLYLIMLCEPMRKVLKNWIYFDKW